MNEPFAREFMGGRNPVGRRILLIGDGSTTERELEVVGVVPDLGLNPGNPKRAAGVYLPLGDTNVLRTALVTPADAPRWTPRLFDLVRDVNPEIEVQWTKTLEEQLAAPVALFRGPGLATLLFGGLALVLSAASLHALTTFGVHQREREIGIRKALGAAPRRVATEILGTSAKRIAIGGVLGAAIALGLLRASRSMPWEVQSANPIAVVLVAILLVGANALALAGPLRRARSIRPMDALRGE